MLIQTSDATFQQDVLESSLPVLVDFWAPWCGPCKTLTPIIEELAQTMNGLIHVAQMNVDDHPHTPALHSIRSIPSLLFFRDRKVLGTQVGVHQHDALTSWITNLLES